ncbi:hypothetical protein KGQ19_26815 [Catenulispora sp. NL8]|uniref:Uncharacterized protein n=1 Tax=Catenulispora pinistramenti TaxID=2705254 RepID=A0ABS5KWR5_9ACTN|nr:hypothetical protein [Catenulispora pinistramenti]MBS2550488.1 hypothetical protein [Catenulispora pinistramenti]
MFGFLNPDYTAYVIDGVTAVHWVHASGELFTYTDRVRTPTGLHATDRRQAGQLAHEIADRYLADSALPQAGAVPPIDTSAAAVHRVPDHPIWRTPA